MSELNLFRRCYLYGAGGHSYVVEDALRANGYSIAGRFDDRPNVTPDTLPGIRLVGQTDPIKIDAPLVIAIGNNAQRAYLSKNLKVEFISVIHPSAIVASSVKIGIGSVVLHGAVLQPNSSIASHVLINTAARVGHDSIVADFVHISPSVTLCGGVTVGEGTHVGAASVVIPGIKIGKWCVIGAGSVVIRDIPNYCTVVGNPAHIIKEKMIPPELYLP